MKRLIIKYLNNELTEKEFEELKQWVLSGNEAEFKKLLKLNRNLDIVIKKFDSKKGYEEILEKISERHTGKAKKLRLNILKYASIFILLIIGGYYVSGNFFSSGTSEHKFVDNPGIILNMGDGTEKILNETATMRITSASQSIMQDKGRLNYTSNNDNSNPKITRHELIVPYGKKFEIELSDGSLVYLNSGTVLKYPSSFNNSQKREVFLKGEAYFKVSKNEQQPFIVKTSEMDVRVLGTKFNVNSYEDEDFTSAVLIEGSVAVSPSKQGYTPYSQKIVPGEMALINKGGIVVERVDTLKSIAWVNDKLYFSNDRFENIIKILERRYNMDIENKYKELNDERYTGTFVDEKLTEILDVFKSNTDFDYTQNKSKIIIEKK